MGEGLDEMLVYRDRCRVAHDVPLDELGIDLQEERPIYVGRFLDRDLKPYQGIRRGQQT